MKIRMSKAPKNTQKQGFSLIQVSVLVAVAGIILASTLPGGEMGSAIGKDRITREKMEKIEAATQNFMAANLRRPCPADGTLAIGSANFGVEDTTSGRCSNANFWTQSTPVTKTGATTTSSSAVATTLSDTTGLSIGMLVTGTNIATDTHIASVDSATQITLDKYPTGASGTLTFTSLAAGVVPTKTLGLPDEYMFDGYGRRMMYMVDIRATDKTTCRNMTTTKTKGAIEIITARGAISIFTDDNVMWSLISYGTNGYGAFPMQGSSIANRVNSGSTTGDEMYNAFIDINTSNFDTAFSQYLIRKEPTLTSGNSYFDDIVWTHESTKNTCCVGKMCNAGTRIDGAASEYLGTNVVIGDINGDGISDMISYKSGVDTIRVVFGKSTGWSPSAGMAVGTANSSRFITITNNSSHSNFASGFAVGDINGDGYDDIVIGYGDVSNSYIKVFYGSATPASTNTSAITNIITFPVTTDTASPIISLGNFANTTKKDILAIVKTASGAGNSTAYVIYGQSSYSLTAEAVTTVAASVGFKIIATTGRFAQIDSLSPRAISGDINNDGYGDILISDSNNNTAYVLFGQSTANWNTDKTTAATGSTPDIVNIDTRVTAGVTEAVKFTNGISNLGLVTLAASEDINADGTYKDIIFNNSNYFYVYYGKTAVSWTSPDLSTASNYNGTNGFRFNVSSGLPSWITSTPDNARVIDFNGDGKVDVLFTEKFSGANGAANSGSTFVALQPSSGWSSIWSSGNINLFGDIFASGDTGLPLNSDVSKGFHIYGAATGDLSKLQRIADVNGDGKLDLIIGAPGHNSNAGAIYVLFGRTLVPWDTSINLGILNY